MTSLSTHVFLPDGATWPDRIRRCRHVVGEHGETCGMPSHNRIHDIPDTTEATAEHRRRAGESETEE